ncbi:MAG: tryptophan synthase subunit alpha [Acholeplasmataceae bacterium]|nr:tryptophan synthase subunit alpha [Acidaminococcaceae bacterium]NLY83264.1 tryptophan synthase subunit alpha [Acholeplasmataceae bacterium]
MSKIAKAFRDNKKAFIPFITAGDPSLAKTRELILTLEKAGAAVVEIGIPFSDPVAEGEVIQRANSRALAAGCTTDKIFDMLLELRQVSQVPIAFLTYVNPIFTYGCDRFFEKCRETGVDGVIVPDVPFEEKGELSPYCLKYGVDLISLIAPTSDSRIQMIAREAEGYIYLVSSLGVTGVRSSITTDLAAIVRQIREVSDKPIAVGFGISTPEQAQAMAAISDGAIVGSALVKIIEESGEACAAAAYDYASLLAEAVKQEK